MGFHHIKMGGVQPRRNDGYGYQRISSHVAFLGCIVPKLPPEGGTPQRFFVSKTTPQLTTSFDVKKSAKLRASRHVILMGLMITSKLQQKMAEQCERNLEH